MTGFIPRANDGISFLPELLGKEQKEHDFLYWEFHERGGKQAILAGRWKAVRLGVGMDPHGPLELYDLETDPGEEHNVADAHPDLVEKFSRLMEEQRVPSLKFNFGRPADPGAS